MLVEMQIKGLMMDPVTHVPIVILRDEEGARVLPIWVGPAEASAIALQIENVLRNGDRERQGAGLFPASEPDPARVRIDAGTERRFVLAVVRVDVDENSAHLCRVHEAPRVKAIGPESAPSPQHPIDAVSQPHAQPLHAAR